LSNFATSQIDEATKEKHSGRFPTIEGGDSPVDRLNALEISDGFY
jgi:hypothetical protein